MGCRRVPPSSGLGGSRRSGQWGGPWTRKVRAVRCIGPTRGVCNCRIRGRSLTAHRRAESCWDEPCADWLARAGWQ
eukprot:13610003-Heterocapsa_arctica.AAC.1